jgi:hypothetical protein
MNAFITSSINMASFSEEGAHFTEEENNIILGNRVYPDRTAGK